MKRDSRKRMWSKIHAWFAIVNGELPSKKIALLTLPLTILAIYVAFIVYSLQRTDDLNAEYKRTERYAASLA